MTVKDFILLDNHTQVETVSKAVCLENRDAGKSRVLTYDLGDFRVEAVYSKKKIIRFRFFKTELHLDYIGQIDLRQLNY